MAQTAEQLAIGATCFVGACFNCLAAGSIKYFDLLHNRTNDYAFSFAAMLDLRGCIILVLCESALDLIHAGTRMCISSTRTRASAASSSAQKLKPVRLFWLTFCLSLSLQFEQAWTLKSCARGRPPFASRIRQNARSLCSSAKSTK